MPLFLPTPPLVTVSASLPTANSDTTAGQSIGSRWLYTGAFPAPEWLVCISAVAGAAVWKYEQASKVLARSSIPFILLPSGSFANNGVLTIGTALYHTHPQCFMYCPANSIFAGSAAGFYYAVMSDQTHATVYNNTYNNGTPVVPGSPTAFASTGPGAYTVTTFPLVSAPLWSIPGGTVGMNDRLQFTGIFENSNNGSTSKLCEFVFGSTYFSGAVVSSSGAMQGQGNVWANGATNKQNTYLWNAFSTSTPALTQTAYDITQAQTAGAALQASATPSVDWVSVNNVEITLFRGP